jgi:hypothetical protein
MACGPQLAIKGYLHAYGTSTAVSGLNCGQTCLHHCTYKVTELSSGAALLQQLPPGPRNCGCCNDAVITTHTLVCTCMPVWGSPEQPCTRLMTTCH